MIKNNLELVAAAIHAAENCKTLYILGCFGAPMNQANKKRYSANYPFNAKENRSAKIHAASADTFGFDCVCFIKGLLWDWAGDANHTYGGANYQSNGVPDINSNSMINACKDISTDFSVMEPGEVVWIPGHIGIYIGDGKAVECTHRWNDGVQVTAVHNIGKITGLNGREWTKHGKLPWISYVKEAPKEELPKEETPKVEIPAENELEKAVTVLALEVMNGRFGNGQERKEKLYRIIQDKVNQLCKEGVS